MRLVRKLQICVSATSQVKNMLTSLRAVTELRNSAIRDRHWAQLMEATGVYFSMSDETTLAELLSLNLHRSVPRRPPQLTVCLGELRIHLRSVCVCVCVCRYEDEVHNIVDKAVKEMSMEKVLRELDSTWAVLELELEVHPRTGEQSVCLSCG